MRVVAWRDVVDVASVLGGTFALIARWPYLRPTAIVTAKTYEYVPGTGSRRCRLAVRNTGNEQRGVAIFLVGLQPQRLWGAIPPDTG